MPDAGTYHKGTKITKNEGLFSLGVLGVLVVNQLPITVYSLLNYRLHLDLPAALH